MRGHRSFAPAGGPGRKQDVADVIGRDRCRSPLGGGVWYIGGPGEELVPAVPFHVGGGLMAWLNRDLDDQIRPVGGGLLGRRGQEGMPIGAEKRTRDEQRPSPAARDHVERFSPGE